MLGVLYDVHGNLPALEAVLAEAEREGVEEWLLGGDYCAFGPGPVETLARLRELPNATWIRGNGERWLVDPPQDLPEETLEFIHAALASSIAQLPAADIDWLIGLPAFADREDAFYCHGSPRPDVDSFAPELRDDGQLASRRTEYDTAPAVAKMREHDWGERVAQRLLKGRD